MPTLFLKRTNFNSTQLNSTSISIDSAWDWGWKCSCLLFCYGEKQKLNGINFQQHLSWFPWELIWSFKTHFKTRNCWLCDEVPKVKSTINVLLPLTHVNFMSVGNYGQCFFLLHFNIIEQEEHKKKPFLQTKYLIWKYIHVANFIWASPDSPQKLEYTWEGLGLSVSWTGFGSRNLGIEIFSFLPWKIHVRYQGIFYAVLHCCLLTMVFCVLFFVFNR